MGYLLAVHLPSEWQQWVAFCLHISFACIDILNFGPQFLFVLLIFNLKVNSCSTASVCISHVVSTFLSQCEPQTQLSVVWGLTANLLLVFYRKIPVRLWQFKLVWSAVVWLAPGQHVPLVTEPMTCMTHDDMLLASPPAAHQLHGLLALLFSMAQAVLCCFGSEKILKFKSWGS